MKLISFVHIDSHLRELLRGTSLAFAHRIVGMAAGFIVSVVMARALGATGLGVITLAGTSTMIGGILARMGLDNAMLRYASAAAHRQDWDEVAGVYRTGMMAAFLASSGVTIMLFLIAPILSIHVFNDPAIILPTQILALTIVPSSLVTLHGEMLKALRFTGASNFVQAAAPPVVNGVILGIVVAANAGGLTPSQAAWISFITSAIISVTTIWLWRRYTPQLRGRRGSFDAGRLLRTSLPLFWIASLNFVMGATDTVMLGIWTATDQVALYSTAARLAVLVSFPLIAINTIAGPKLAGLHEAGATDDLHHVMRATTIIAVLIALPIAAAYWTFPELALLVYGTDFVPAAGTLTLLSLGHFVNVATGPVGNLLMLTGREKIMRNNIAVSSMINVVLNVVLIPRFGIAGAAAATAFSLALMNLVCVVLVYRELKMLPFWVPFAAQKA